MSSYYFLPLITLVSSLIDNSIILFLADGILIDNLTFFAKILSGNEVLSKIFLEPLFKLMTSAYITRGASAFLFAPQKENIYGFFNFISGYLLMRFVAWFYLF